MKNNNPENNDEKDFNTLYSDTGAKRAILYAILIIIIMYIISLFIGE